MTYRDTPIAVVGMALRAPGAETPESFWENVLAGRDCLTRATESQLRLAGVPERLIQNPFFVRSRPLLRNPGAFDPGFFGMSAREAKLTDPAHRLFLTCAWEVMERAGVVPGPEAGVVGVYGGTAGTQDSYAIRNFGGGAMDLDDPAVWLPVNLAAAVEHLTSRVCFKLDLSGPNSTVLAACATSLVAVHLAAQSLSAGDCDLALAGGATVQAPHWPGYLQTEGGPVSASGTIRPFDERADGTVFGSGVGVIALKRLDDALAQGNDIHAVILGSGIFNDGGQKPSFTAPAAFGQIAAISRALASAGVGAETIGFVEAHGTGTLIGDPIEVQAMSEVFTRDAPGKQFCALGAVKANIGHTGASAGIMGLIKTCMALKHGVIPPNIHFQTPNSQLELPDTPFYIPIKQRSWPAKSHPRRAGVSAFGFGGNNAHIVLEEPPRQPRRSTTGGRKLLALSAKTSDALQNQVERLGRHLASHPEVALDDVAHTLQTGRKGFEHRAAVVASNVDEARELLARGNVRRGRAQKQPQAVFAFPGQGSQRPGMGRSLYDSDPTYHREVQLCAELFLPHLDLDIRSLLYGDGGDPEAQLSQTRYTHPALFVVEYALARRLMMCGVTPSVMIGHSVGELVAACLAGVFSLNDAVALVALRGKLMQACPRGGMMALFCSPDEVGEKLGDRLELAAFNAPDVTVVSGPLEAIAELRDHLDREGLPYRLLRTSHGFHSHLMDSVVTPFQDAVSRTRRSAPRIPFISSVTGRLISSEDATDPHYWATQLRKPVQFARGVETLQQMEPGVWIEVGPGQALSNLVRRQTDAAAVIPTLEDGGSSDTCLPDIVSRIWAEGLAVDWSGLEPGSDCHKVTLPTYPFESKKYWIESPIFEPDGSPEEPRIGVARPEEPELLHVQDWRRESLRTPSLSSEDGWLILENNDGLGAQIKDTLRKAGVRVLSLVAADRFENRGSDRFLVRPGVVDDLVAALAAGTASGWIPRRVLHLWQVTRGHVETDPVRVFDDCLPTGFDTLVALVKALHEFGVENAVKVTVGANGVVAIEDEEGPRCWEKASLLGPCRVTGKETTSVSFQLVDFPEDSLASDWLAGALLGEASSPGSETLTALRERGRYVEIFRRLSSPTAGPGIRTGAVVLITGGTGGLGLEVAERLFEMAQARLVLLTRWDPPPPEQWPLWTGQNNRIGRAIAKVVALKTRGAEVLLLRGDASNAEEMTHVVEQARTSFGDIHGVVHTAGVSSPSLVLETELETARRVFAPKVTGALILEQLLAGTPLDFFASFSSIAGVVPARGQAAYSAANAVLDALARRNRCRNWRQVCSIGWDAWEGVGMAVDHGRKQNQAALLDNPDHRLEDVVAHPLWHSFRRDGDRLLFVGELQPEHWLLDEHRIGGIPTLAGTAILEMALGAFRHLHPGSQPVAISNVAFLRLLQVPPGGLEVWLICEEDGPCLHFEMRGRGSAVGGQRLRDLTLYSTGTISAIEEPPARKVSVPSVDAHLVPQNPIYRNSPHWNCVDGCATLEDTTVLRLSLPERFRSETCMFELHPALLDRALAFVHLTRMKGVPTSIDELRIYRRVPPSMIAIIRDSQNREGAVSVLLVGADGQLITDVENYIQLPIDADKINRQTDAKTGPGARPLTEMTEAETSKLGFSWSIPLNRGLDTFQELLQSSNLPPHVIVTPQPLSGVAAERTAPDPGSTRAEDQRMHLTSEYRPPSNPIEERLIEIWTEILVIEPIGINDDFMDLGGDSITSIQVLSRVRREWGVGLPGGALFDSPTVAQLAKNIEELSAT